MSGVLNISAKFLFSFSAALLELRLSEDPNRKFSIKKLQKVLLMSFDENLKQAFVNAVKSRSSSRAIQRTELDPQEEPKKKKRRRGKGTSVEAAVVASPASSLRPVEAQLVVTGLVVDPAVVNTGLSMMEFYYMHGWYAGYAAATFMHCNK
jgi:hypothetical protein